MATARRKGSAAGADILVVDDYENVREVVSRMLTESGFEVQTARNAAEALHLLDESPFGLVLTDFNMPEMDGLALAAKIKSLFPATPVVLMTGSDIQIGGEEKGCVVSVLRKPFRWQELEEAVLTAMAEENDTYAGEARPQQQ